MRVRRGLPAAAATVCVVIAGLSGCDLLDDEYPVGQFINDLYLRIKPDSAQPGATITFFVNGEPPVRLRSRRYVDVLTEAGDPIFRLASGAPKGDRIVPFPPPDTYVTPTEAVPLLERQRVRLPTDLEPGRYTLRGSIVGARNVTRERGSPTGSLRVVASK